MALLTEKSLAMLCTPNMRGEGMLFYRNKLLQRSNGFDPASYKEQSWSESIPSVLRSIHYWSR